MEMSRYSGNARGNRFAVLRYGLAFVLSIRFSAVESRKPFVRRYYTHTLTPSRPKPRIIFLSSIARHFTYALSSSVYCAHITCVYLCVLFIMIARSFTGPTSTVFRSRIPCRGTRGFLRGGRLLNGVHTLQLRHETVVVQTILKIIPEIRRNARAYRRKNDEFHHVFQNRTTPPHICYEYFVKPPCF